jgi:glycerophosphoryl diester phosphodiesterase
MSLMPALPIRPPLIVHHMAALDDMQVPQNSLEAIVACLDAGAAVVEVDVTALAAGDYLLVHDPLLESETSGRGPVAECTTEQARLLTFGGPCPGCRVPLLSEAVRLIDAHAGATHLQLDFKNEEPFASDEPLQRLIHLIEPLGSRVLVSTGADWQLRRLRRLAPWLSLGFDVMNHLDWEAAGGTPQVSRAAVPTTGSREPAGTLRDPHDHPQRRGVHGYYDDHPLAVMRGWPTADYLADRCESLMDLVPSVGTFYIRHTLLAQSLSDGFNWADALHRRGIRLDAWTMDVTDPVARANAPRLLAAGVDLFTTNTPRALAQLLNVG